MSSRQIMFQSQKLGGAIVMKYVSHPMVLSYIHGI